MPTMDLSSATRAARRSGRLLGVGAVAIALAQVLVAAAGAAAGSGAIVSVQRGLVDLATGGGANIAPPFVQLVPMFVATYLMSLLTFMGTLVLCWYAGRVAAAETGRQSVGARAGYWVALVCSFVWLAVTLLVVGITHLDGTVAWFVGSGAVVLTSSASHAISGAYMTAPGPLYVIVQLVVLCIQDLLGVAVALALGSLAGRLGAQYSPRHTTVAPQGEPLSTSSIAPLS